MQIEFETFGLSHDRTKKLELVERLKWHPLFTRNRAELRLPQLVFAVLEDHGLKTPDSPDQALKRIFFARHIADAQRRLLDTFACKKRRYLGTTSMSAQLSFFVANQALARDSALVLDPFVGTGSLLLAAAHFGSFVMGNDIDMRVLKGEPKRNIYSNFDQFGLTDRLISLFASDQARSPFAVGPWFDAIIGDRMCLLDVFR